MQLLNFEIVRTKKRGLLIPIHINEGRKATHQGAELSASHLEPLVLVLWIHWEGLLESKKTQNKPLFASNFNKKLL